MIMKTVLLSFICFVVVAARSPSFDVVKFLDQQNADLSSTMRDRKFITMEQSPFIFFRGANALYYNDFCKLQFFFFSLPILPLTHPTHC